MKLKLNRPLSVLWMTVFLWMVVSVGIAEAADTNSSSPSDAVDWRQSIDAMLATETTALEEVKILQKQVEAGQKTVALEMNTYRMQISAYGNLLAFSDARLPDLEKAWIETVNSVRTITQQLKTIRQKYETIKAQTEQVSNQIDLNTKQLQDIQSAGAVDAAGVQLQKKLKTLVDVLNARKSRLEKISALHADAINQMEDILGMMTDLAKSFEEKIQARKTTEIFRKRASLLQQLQKAKLDGDTREVLDALSNLTRPSFYQEHWRSMRETYLPHTGLALVLLVLWLWLVHRLHVRIRKWLEIRDWSEMPFAKISIDVLNHSSGLGAVCLFVYGAVLISGGWPYWMLLESLLDVLLIILFCRWGKALMIALEGLNPPRFPQQLAGSIRHLIPVIRYYGMVVVLARFLLSEENLWRTALQTFGEIALLGWTAVAVHVRKPEFDIWVRPQWLPYARAGVAVLFWIITGGAVILEWTGYGVLAVFWLSSWGQTAVLACWGTIAFRGLNQWSRRLSDTDNAETKPGDRVTSDAASRWFLIRIGWILLPVLLLAAILMSWGAKQTIFGHLFHVLSYPIVIGDIRFSLFGVLSAAVILLIARVFLKTWRKWVQNNLFRGSGLDRGVIESIATLTTYGFWALAILIALQAMGVSSTSLAVVFGALGIGLGFGLQNIFNNFISGIILLFERPIQVGDAIEINGTWGIVKKINFRSTQVQTYDNASLIIPNSEFISNSVTNWTFKDQRIRRIITVGVAYGTDTDLVVNTLTDIAMKSDQVLKRPKPDVVFSDFGDSALVFKLRVWTTIDDMVSVENHLRHEIYRAFTELNIEIPFPQRDVHIKE